VLEPVSYNEGQAIFLAGDKPEWFYVLVSGWAEETHEGVKVRIASICDRIISIIVIIIPTGILRLLIVIFIIIIIILVAIFIVIITIGVIIIVGLIIIFF
jgi:hypothetical protein